MTFAIEEAESRKERPEAAAKTQLDNGETDAQVAGTVPDRFIALTFDDVYLLNSDVPPMRTAANAFIDSMAPNDRIGFFTTSGLLTDGSTPSG